MIEDGNEGANFGTGEMKIPSPVVDDHSALLLGSGEKVPGERVSIFQPNPFWGSQKSRFSKW